MLVPPPQAYRDHQHATFQLDPLDDRPRDAEQARPYTWNSHAAPSSYDPLSAIGIVLGAACT